MAWTLCSPWKCTKSLDKPRPCLGMLLVKVEPYSIPGSFLKLEYLKTDLNEDIMIPLSIDGYVDVIWHSWKNISGWVHFFFFAKCQDSPFTWKSDSTIWSFISRSKLGPQHGICTMRILKTFPKDEMVIIIQLEGICMVKADSHVFGTILQGRPERPSCLLFSKVHINRK